jgi:hypothetical protein
MAAHAPAPFSRRTSRRPIGIGVAAQYALYASYPGVIVPGVCAVLGSAHRPMRAHSRAMWANFARREPWARAPPVDANVRARRPANRAATLRPRSLSDRAQGLCAVPGSTENIQT